MKAKWRTIIEWELDTDSGQSRVLRQFTSAINTEYTKKKTTVVEATAKEGEKVEW
jgi:hypothetical protein